MTGAQLLRTVMPEARVILNGKTYEIGAKLDFKEKGYFKKEWLDLLKTPEENFQYQGYSLSKIEPYFPTKIQFWTGQKEQASGQKISFSYTHPHFPGLLIQVHYEIYDNLANLLRNPEGWVEQARKGFSWALDFAAESSQGKEFAKTIDKLL
jgi:hypothetical protein